VPRETSADQCLFRFVWPRRVFSALPATIVERTPRRVVLWIAPETPVRWPPGRRLPIGELARQRWPHEEARWYGGRLMIHELGSSHSVYVSWGRDAELVGWYVNLEEPWRERSFGFDTTDDLLDVWIDPDRSWRWKDEDHLDEAAEIGLFTPQKVPAIQAEGARVIERIEAWSSPFDEGWETWCPDPDWPLPAVPEGWNRLS
jgi:hypothetical protein